KTSLSSSPKRAKMRSASYSGASAHDEDNLGVGRGVRDRALADRVRRHANIRGVRRWRDVLDCMYMERNPRRLRWRHVDLRLRAARPRAAKTLVVITKEKKWTQHKF